MQLRDFHDSDLTPMHELDQLCFRTGIAYTKAELDFYAHQPAVLTLVAEDKGSLAGFAMTELVRLRKELAGHVVTIDVHPDYRRCGIGRLLMAETEGWLRRHNITTCSLEVAVDDPGALSFYRRLSYVPAGKIKDYYMGKLDAYVLRKSFYAAESA